MSCFFYNDPATTEIYTLSLHDALPIYDPWVFNNYGTNDIQSGTLHFDVPFNNLGLVTIPSGTRLEMAVGGSASGTFDNQNGGVVLWSGGAYNLNSGVMLNGPGNYTNRTALMLNAPVAIQNF